MRLIDADALKTRVAEETKIAEGLGVEMAVLAQTMRDCIYEELENSPTIEAGPIKWGQWKPLFEEYAIGWMQCSECGAEFFVKTNFCPHCGAKMEVENEVN